MIPIMAWRNTWRNPTRSMVVIISIALGIWAAMFMTGFATGMSRSYINNAIDNVLAHIQIHEEEFLQDQSVQHIIPDIERVEKLVSANDLVKAHSIRSVANGMIASSKLSRGVMIKGINPTDEIKVSTISQKLVEGSYLEGKRKNQIMLGKKLAEKLNVKMRSKLVLTFQDLNGTITAGAFRVAGIFESGSGPFDEATVFVKKSDLNKLLFSQEDSTKSIQPDQISHEIALMLQQPDQVEIIETQLQEQLPGLQVDTYREVAPELQLYESQLQNISMIYLIIIMLALIFGIINTMLMAVLERMKELGMLMAIGMNKLKVFLMIVMETFLLCLIGTPLGILLGMVTITYLGKYGIDLSAFSKSLQMYGLSEHVYFDIEPIVYLQIPLTVAVTALLAAIYPALKAIRLRPVEAIRKI